MSGSSLDGVDLALAGFNTSNPYQPEWQLYAAYEFQIPPGGKQSLSGSDKLSSKELLTLDATYGKWLGQSIKAFLENTPFLPEIQAIHGHTVFHQPQAGFSFQLGCGAHIAHHSGIDTLTNVRAMDIAAGGLGAPYAPLADRALFPGYDAYLNLGGISNISFHNENNWQARDCGACNQLLNKLARRTGLEYDKDGNLAAGGNIVPSLLNSLLLLDELILAQKAMSNQWVQDVLIKPFDNRVEKVEDLLATAVEWIAYCIVKPLKSAFNGTRPIKVLVSGGGTFNLALMRKLKIIAGDRCEFVIPEPEIITFKEALLMAYIGFLWQMNLPAKLSETTSAVKDHLQGSMYKGRR